jgi:hypothetical protein
VDIAFDAAYFIAGTLLTEQSGHRYFAYIPSEEAFVHNANLWGAAWCVRVGSELRDAELRTLGMEVGLESVRMQSTDGSWLYGTLPHHRFIDGFHTGYNLEALSMINEDAPDPRVRAAIEKGCKYYLARLFDEAGTPKYFRNSLYPLDTHNFAQALITLLRVLGGEAAESKAKVVLRRAMEELYIARVGRFAYQKHRLFRNSVNYSRWTQAWMYYALAVFNVHFSRKAVYAPR